MRNPIARESFSSFTLVFFPLQVSSYSQLRSSRVQVVGMTGPGYPKEFLVFYDRIYKLVDDPSTDSIISWSKTNKSFVIWNVDELIRRKFLSRFFSNTFTEFVSWLEFYGFRETKGSAGQWEFGNKKFVRGHPLLFAEMHTKSMMDIVYESSRASKAKAQVEDRLHEFAI